MSSYFESGMFVRKPAWHMEGNVVDKRPTSWRQARQWAGLDWEPLDAPAFGFEGLDAKGNVVYDPALSVVEGSYVLIEDKRRIVRQGGDKAGKTLGVASDEYAVINNRDLGRVTDALLAAITKKRPGRKMRGTGKVNYETLVVMEEGKSVAVVLWLDDPIKVPGDNSPTLPYLAVTTRNDGAGATLAMSTDIRIVCANTRNAAENRADASNVLFRFRHNAKWEDRLDEAAQTLLGLQAQRDEYEDMALHLAMAKMSTDQQREALDLFIPVPLTTADVSQRTRNNIDNARKQFWLILDSDTCKGIKDTPFGFVQAGDELITHYLAAERGQDSAMRRQLLKPQPRKLQLLNIVREVANV